MKRLLLTAAFVLFASQLYAQVNTVKIYIAPQIGDGTFWNPFRSKVFDYLDRQAGESIEENDNPARRYSICAVKAQSSTFAIIDSDPEIVAVTPIDVTLSQLAAQLDRSISSLPTEFKTKMQNAFEQYGISFAWVGASNTVRDVLRYLLRVHSFSQRIDGENNENIREFIRKNLDTTVAQLTIAQRNAVKTWMESKGLATGWITNQTTVRQILHGIVTDLGFGVIHLSGQGF